MQLVILCGGKGTRLKKLTKKTVKPMLLFNKKPFLERLIEYFYKQGFKKILLLCGYKSIQIKNYFKKRKKYNLQFSTENKALGTGGAIKNAYNLLDDKFILINGDSFLPENYKKFNSKLIAKKKIIITVYKNKNNKFITNNVLVKKNKIIRYSKRNNKNFNYVDAGVYMIKKEIFRNIRINIFSFEKYFFNKLIISNKLDFIKTKNFFYDIGTKSNLQEYRNKLKF